MNPKKPKEDQKIPSNFSITRRSDARFRKKCEDLGISHNTTLEELIKEFLDKN